MMWKAKRYAIISSRRQGDGLNYSHILWDFNGTLFNDVEAGLCSANVLLKRRNKAILTDIGEYRNLFCFPITEYYTRLGLDLRRENFHDLAVEWLEQYHIFSKDAGLYEGITDVLSIIQGRGITQIVLSASERNILLVQLEKLGVLCFFETVLGLDNIYANSKVDIAKRWAEKATPSRAVLIGDTLHDYEVARAVGIDCVLLSGGHQNEKTLCACSAPVLDNAACLPDFLGL